MASRRAGYAYWDESIQNSLASEPPVELIRTGDTERDCDKT
jgi:hypothetical protein